MANRTVWIIGSFGPDLLIVDAKTGDRIEGITGLRIDCAIDDVTFASLRTGKTEELVLVEKFLLKG